MVAKAKEKERALANLHDQVLYSQGPLLQATIYKLIKTNSFAEYVKACGGAINPLVKTETIELIRLDYPHIDITKSSYGYEKDAKE